MTEIQVPATSRTLSEPPFSVHTTRTADDTVTVEIAGGLDMYTAPMFDAAFALVAADMAERLGIRVRIDVSDLSFCDTAGLDAVQGAVSGLEAAGARVDLVGARRQFRRLLAFAADHCWLAAGPLAVAADRPAPAVIEPDIRPTTHQESGMTTRIGRPSRADKPRNRIGTTELLSAVADLGPNWPARFGNHEIVDVNEAVDRELIAGTLLDAVTLSPQGQALLRRR